MKSNFLKYITLLICGLTLISGCGYYDRKKEGELVHIDKSAEQLYADAQKSLSKGNWQTALERLQLLEAKYPYGIHAQQAQMDTIYAYYRLGDTPGTLAAADRFIKLHPAHVSVDYAHYLKGLASYLEENSLIGRLIGVDDLSDRDSMAIRDALAAFKAVYTLFPNSQYAPDSRKRARYLLELLAKNEISIANYYYSREAYVAAANRAKNILENYATTPSVESALAIMMFSYENMEFDDLSADSRRVLALNFPDSGYLMQTAKTVNFIKTRSTKKAKGDEASSWFSAIFD